VVVPEARTEPGARFWGREAETDALRQSVNADAFPCALVISGPAGIGKTTLWEAGLDEARSQGMPVLSTRASEAEARLAFAGLIDLLDGVDVRGLALPRPQSAALEVALRRADPEAAAEPGALALGFLNVLRALAARRPVLVAVDDVQWLDGPSAEAVGFAARRLESEPVGFLLARRPNGPSTVESALDPARRQVCTVGPLSLGAIRHLLAERLGLSLPRPLLRRLTDATLGNPLFALELGRELLERGLPKLGDELPVPDAVEALLGTRVERLAAPVRRALLAIALADLRRADLVELAGAEAVDDAMEAGLLVEDGDRFRAAHPLLAAAARTRARASDRRALHAELAGLVGDEELRARHLALSADAPSEELAATVAAAAAHASARGSRQEAVELAEHAVRLTPAGSGGRGDRLLAVAEYLLLAGEKQRATELLEPELDAIPPGPARKRALLILAAGVITSTDDLNRSVERAVIESRSDEALHATLRGVMAINAGFLRLTGLAEAEAAGEQALDAARAGGPELERALLDGLAWVRVIRGRPVDELEERYREVADLPSYIGASPERSAVQRLAWRGEIGAARTVLAQLYALADQRAELASYVLLRLHLCELELRAGELDAAARLLEEWAESPDRELPSSTPYRRCRALLAATRGLLDECERWASAALADAEAADNRWDALEATRALGIAALLRHDPTGAAKHLRAVWAHMVREGIDEPGAFPVAADLVEALVELGEIDEADAVVRHLQALAEAQGHPWGLVTARRGGALIHVDDAAAEALREASEEYGRLGLRYDRARTLLQLGRAQRRRRKWAAAREALEQAAADFHAMGAPGWAEEAESELGRVGARRPTKGGELTEAERRVVGLALEGRSNKEIAQALFVTVNTVEAHLSHAYAKLGVRSRAQLAALDQSI
jgi:DNA-binding CsgD family transcriptional regulator